MMSMILSHAAFLSASPSISDRKVRKTNIKKQTAAIILPMLPPVDSAHMLNAKYKTQSCKEQKSKDNRNQ